MMLAHEDQFRSDRNFRTATYRMEGDQSTCHQDMSFEEQQPTHDALADVYNPATDVDSSKRFSFGQLT